MYFFSFGADTKTGIKRARERGGKIRALREGGREGKAGGREQDEEEGNNRNLTLVFTLAFYRLTSQGESVRVKSRGSPTGSPRV